MALDLILKGGRIIDPSQKLDQIADIGFRRRARGSARASRPTAGPTCATSPGTSWRLA